MDNIRTPLVKEQLAVALKEAILRADLNPGQRIIEGKWAREFGVAQASVREAINLLIGEGFLVKDAGRSARVVRYSHQDMVHIHEVRAALEGMAAQLAAAHKADLSHMEAALQHMNEAILQQDVSGVIRSDLEFHLGLGQASGNAMLADMLRRTISPHFAFVRVFASKTHIGVEIWAKDMPRHRRMIELIREGNPEVAGLYVQHAVGGFVHVNFDILEEMLGPQARQKRKRRRRTVTPTQPDAPEGLAAYQEPSSTDMPRPEAASMKSIGL